MINEAIGRILGEVIQIRDAYSRDIQSDYTAIALLDDIIAMLEQELVN